jgi:hypothetical protein
MATSFSDGRSRREPPTMGKQLVSFITCSWESSAPFFVIYKAGANPRRIGDRLVWVVRQSNYLSHWATPALGRSLMHTNIFHNLSNDWCFFHYCTLFIFIYLITDLFTLLNAVTSIKQSPVLKMSHFSCPDIEHFIWHEPLLRSHMSPKTTFSLVQIWTLNTGLTILFTI